MLTFIFPDEINKSAEFKTEHSHGFVFEFSTSQKMKNITGYCHSEVVSTLLTLADVVSLDPCLVGLDYLIL